MRLGVGQGADFSDVCDRYLAVREGVVAEDAVAGIVPLEQSFGEGAILPAVGGQAVALGDDALHQG